MEKFYVMFNGAAWFAKTGAYFESQGGLAEAWGKGWKPIWANSIDHARELAKQGVFIKQPEFHIDREHMKVAAETLQRLREARLWHWKQVLSQRKMAEEWNNSILAAAFNTLANFHLGHVQTLNEFFEIGDTAEKDASK